jgi:hypothetical protein
MADGSLLNERWIVTIFIERDGDGANLTPAIVLLVVLVTIFLIFIITR